MEALPIFLDRLVTPTMSIVISVTMVLIFGEILPQVIRPRVFSVSFFFCFSSNFGEILPQAVFSHYRLPIGAYLSPFVRVLEFLFYPIAKPVAVALDYFLGPDHPTVYRRAELKELTKRHLITEGAHGTHKGVN